tara:strand:- start:272 stop:1543 length:1272 start_codon:yes stop_codon:yes gene_type:complete
MIKKIKLLIAIASITIGGYAQNGNSNGNGQANGNGSSQWKINGNNATTTDFLGTVNQTDLILKSNNIEGLRLDQQGKSTFSKGVKFNQDIVLEGEFIFGDNKKIGYLPASGGNPEIIGFGKTPQLDPVIDPCFSPSVTTINQFSGTLQSYGNNANGDLNVMSMGFDGANGIIDLRGSNGAVGPKLLINYYCGKDVAINTGSKGGNVSMTTATMGMVGIGTGTPTAKLDVRGSVKIHQNPLYLKDENHGLIYSYQNSGDIDGPILFGWNGGVLASKQGTVTKNILTWESNGHVNINSDASQNNKSFTINDVNSGEDVFRVTSDGHVWATELDIKLKGSFPDYVFEESYPLMSLDNLKIYIEKNNHLPNIPKASDIEANGLNIGDMQVKQMEKIEELTLYLLEIKKELETVKGENIKLRQLILKK